MVVEGDASIEHNQRLDAPVGHDDFVARRLNKCNDVDAKRNCDFAV